AVGDGRLAIGVADGKAAGETVAAGSGDSSVSAARPPSVAASEAAVIKTFRPGSPKSAFFVDRAGDMTGRFSIIAGLIVTTAVLIACGMIVIIIVLLAGVAADVLSAGRWLLIVSAAGVGHLLRGSKRPVVKDLAGG